MKRLTIADLGALKRRSEKIAMLTAYDYPSARLLDEAGIPVILVGDSLGMAVLGHNSTLPVTMEDMIHHAKAVVRGSSRAHVVFDMPFMSYQAGEDEAVANAGRALKESGAQSVKLEGGARIAALVRRLTASGIPVMGHLGLTPQSVNQLGGFKMQGKTPEAFEAILNDAEILEKSGVYALVLECVPAELAKVITERLSIPVIGIGAGPYCDGQVQVFHDILGLSLDFMPKHAKRYADLADTIRAALRSYKQEVEQSRFPETVSVKEAVHDRGS